MCFPSTVMYSDSPQRLGAHCRAHACSDGGTNDHGGGRGREYSMLITHTHDSTSDSTSPSTCSTESLLDLKNPPRPLYNCMFSSPAVLSLIVLNLTVGSRSSGPRPSLSAPPLEPAATTEPL